MHSPEIMLTVFLLLVMMGMAYKAGAWSKMSPPDEVIIERMIRRRVERHVGKIAQDEFRTELAAAVKNLTLKATGKPPPPPPEAGKGWGGY